MITQKSLGKIGTTPIWRYMPLARFADLVKTQSLFFCPITYYQKKSDPLEASMTMLYKQTLDENFRYRKNHRDHFYHPEFENPSDEFNALCRRIFLSCWHQNKTENFAFWRIYGGEKTHEAVAIVSTPRRLLQSIKSGESSKELNTRMTAQLFIEEVKYIRHLHNSFQKTNEEIDIFQPFLYKHRGYRYEQEIRALLYFNESRGADQEPFKEFSKTYKIKVKLDDLITEIRLGFNAPKALRCKVQKLIKSQALNIPIVSSELDDDPIR